MEVWIPPEAIKAGEEALRECRQYEFDETETVKQVFLAVYGMRKCVEDMFLSDTRH